MMAIPRLLKFISEVLSTTHANNADTTLGEARFRFELQIGWIAGMPVSTSVIALKLGLSPSVMAQYVIDAIEEGFARTTGKTQGGWLLVPGPLARARLHQWAELVLRFTQEHYPNEIEVTRRNVATSLREVDAIQWHHSD